MPFDDKEERFIHRDEVPTEVPAALRPYLDAFAMQTDHAGYILFVMTSDFQLHLTAGANHDRFPDHQTFMDAVGVLRHLEHMIAETLNAMEAGDDEEEPPTSYE